jgi:polysaccharide pyruvyl transferase WcaK-like protein
MSNIKPATVCLMGTSLDTGNRGVLALAASLVKLVDKVRPGARIFFFVGAKFPRKDKIALTGKTVDIEIINFRLSPKAELAENLFWLFFLSILYRFIPVRMFRKVLLKNSALAVLFEADFIGDIRGGDSFSDIYGIRRFLIGCLPDIICLMLGKDLVMLPQTYGPFNASVSRMTSRAILKKCKSVHARDMESLAIADELIGGKDPNTIFCPDVAFILDSISPSSEETAFLAKGGAGSASREPLIGINVNGLMYNGGYTRDNMFGLKMDYKKFIHTLVQMLMVDTSARILFIPHTIEATGHVENDLDACLDAMKVLAPELLPRISLVSGEYSPSGIKSIIGSCDFFIGSRMHSCIAALSQEIPTVAVAYSRKFRGVFDSIGVGHLVMDAREMGAEDAVEQIKLIFLNREAESTVIAGKVSSARETVYKTFEGIFSE